MQSDNFIEEVKYYLKSIEVVFKEDLNMSFYTYTKVGGQCLLYVTPDTKYKLASIIKFLSLNKVNYSVIGETSNTIFLDDVIYGIVISTKLINDIELIDDKVTVSAGNNLSDFLRLLFSKKITGFEGLEGIPGSVGGAIFMNAGAYGYQISDCVDSVECVDSNGKLKSLTKEQCQFKQRGSVFRINRELIITSVTFKLKKGDIDTIYKKVERYHIARHSYQEFVLPNAGSIFTAPECVYEELTKINKLYRFKYKILKKIYHNKLARMLKYKAPNRTELNKLTIKTFGLKDFESCISKKHINMFANGGINSWDMVNYIKKIKSILGDSVSIENEIIVNSIIDWKGKNLNK